MPGSGGSGITYKTFVLSLLSVCIALVSYIGVKALGKLDQLEIAVITMQASRTVEDRGHEQLENTVKVLSAQVEFLTNWMTDTFGPPKPKRPSKFAPQ